VPIVQRQHVGIVVNDLRLLDGARKLELAGRRRQVVIPLGYRGCQLGAVVEHDAFVESDGDGEDVRIFDHTLGEVGNELTVVVASSSPQPTMNAMSIHTSSRMPMPHIPLLFSASCAQ